MKVAPQRCEERNEREREASDESGRRALQALEAKNRPEFDIVFFFFVSPSSSSLSPPLSLTQKLKTTAQADDGAGPVAAGALASGAHGSPLPLSSRRVRAAPHYDDDGDELRFAAQPAQGQQHFHRQHLLRTSDALAEAAAAARAAAIAAAAMSSTQQQSLQPQHQSRRRQFSSSGGGVVVRHAHPSSDGAPALPPLSERSTVAAPLEHGVRSSAGRHASGGGAAARGHPSSRQGGARSGAGGGGVGGVGGAGGTASRGSLTGGGCVVAAAAAAAPPDTFVASSLRPATREQQAEPFSSRPATSSLAATAAAGEEFFFFFSSSFSLFPSHPFCSSKLNLDSLLDT